MRYGVCGDPTVATIAHRAGFDFAEWSIGALLQPAIGDDAFAAHLPALRQAALPYPTANCFVPADLKIAGPTADPTALRSYVEKVCRRAAAADVKIIVFGSGGARAIPDGWDPARGRAQIVAFCEMVGPLAADHGIAIAVEPLNRKECNVLNTLAECAALVREVAHPAVRLLVDSYHLFVAAEPVTAIVDHGDLLVHAHIATGRHRRAPGAEPEDFGPFFAALRTAGYAGRIAIEADLGDPAVTLPTALATMKGR